EFKTVKTWSKKQITFAAPESGGKRVVQVLLSDGKVDTSLELTFYVPMTTQKASLVIQDGSAFRGNYKPANLAQSPVPFMGNAVYMKLQVDGADKELFFIVLDKDSVVHIDEKLSVPMSVKKKKKFFIF
ncbi:hypothetical protein KW791_03480, partial [Candidatus Parcubacteria bacterium]|nr:hypothetical protein [Candidatus Parcubacteria bacterium]